VLRNLIELRQSWDWIGQPPSGDKFAVSELEGCKIRVPVLRSKHSCKLFEIYIFPFVINYNCYENTHPQGRGSRTNLALFCRQQ
jgi:hypothetical protein